MGANLSKLKKGIPVLDGRFKLVVSPDGLKAYLVPQLPGERPTKDDLQILSAILKEEGITYGLLKIPELEGTSWLLARGEPAKPGEDARLKFLVDLRSGPRQNGGRLNYREMNTLVCVSEGEIIAQKIPPTPGVPGRNVFGEEIPAPSGRDIPLKLGKNVLFDRNSGLVLAETAGVVRFEKNRFEVWPDFVIQGDVNWDVGNINFKGRKLTITGHVRRGFKLRVEGDLEIQGSVEDEVEIEVVGNLTIKGLAHGKNLKIKCWRKASLNEVEYARLEISQNLEINEYLLQARASVGGDLLATKGVGALVGGQYLVRGQVVARILGSGGQAKTLVHAGYDASKMAKLEEVEEKLFLLQREKRPLVLSLRKGLELLRAGKLPPHKLLVLEKAKERLQNFLLEERKLKGERERLLSEIENLEEQQVIVLSRVFPGVTIGIGRQTFTVTRTLERGAFFLKGKQILFRPLNFTS